MAKKLKTILISQPKPTAEKSPYFDLADRQKLTIDFRPFIHVEGVEGQEFRQQRIDLAEHTAVILTSRNAVDHFFRLAAELRFEVPDSMKYFCISEATAFLPSEIRGLPQAQDLFWEAPLSGPHGQHQKAQAGESSCCRAVI
jgi:hypothetical protein